MNHAQKPDLDAALREALKPERASAELKAKVLAQANRWTWTPLRVSLMAAAALLVVGLGAVFAPRLSRDAQGPLALDRAVSAASAEFADTRDLCFKGGGCAGKGCGDWAQIRAGFRAPLPACVKESELHGGGACRIAGQSAVHYTLQDGRMVYVFSQELDACKGGRRAVMEKETLIAQAWNEQGRGYLLLARK